MDKNLFCEQLKTEVAAGDCEMLYQEMCVNQETLTYTDNSNVLWFVLDLPEENKVAYTEVGRPKTARKIAGSIFGVIDMLEGGTLSLEETN